MAAETPRTLVIVSDNEYLLERAVAQFIAQAKAQQPDAELSELDAADITAGDIAEAAGGSLFSAAVIVSIANLELLPKELHGQVLELARDDAAEVCVVLAQGNPKRGAAFLGQLRDAGVPFRELATPKSWEVARWAAEEARALGARMDKDAAELLVATLGTDLRTLSAAITQLLADSTDGEITVEQLTRYFSGRAEITSFAVADAVLESPLDQTLAKLRWALDSGVEPVLITAAIGRALTQLGKYWELQGQVRHDKDLADRVGVPTWKLKHLARQSRHWRPEAIGRSIIAVANADAQVKGAGGNPGYEMENLVLRLYRERVAA
ncbi:MAG: DNA polymerase III subunit delta [Propionibacteriaceae bacterium]|jgi:DNA polymerase-3 subunit delta|nr:DNA polymerase III subunit delta [Propionibacteriaceae bacterium]